MGRLLNTSIRYLKGIGPKRTLVFNRLGIKTVEDILYYFPRRYEDRTSFVPVAKLEEDKVQTIKAKVLTLGNRTSRWRNNFNILELTVSDGSGKISCVWFNQPYLKDYFEVGQTLILYGKVERYAERLQLASPEFEIVSEENRDSLNIGRIVPIYSLPERMTQRAFRQLVKGALDKTSGELKDYLAYDIRSRNNLLNLAVSLKEIHFPENWDIQRQAYERLSFEEFFFFQLPLALRKLRKSEKEGIAHKADGELVKAFLEKLPFSLTAAQRKVIAEITDDMVHPRVMQRLLQGDVGSGKTVVATIACLTCIQGGYQAAFMVPTEILAKQHFAKVSSWFIVHGPKLKKIRVGLLTSSTKSKDKERLYGQIKKGEIDFIIGTHALLEEGVQFKNLGLAVIDEQHKFGVGQRALLPQKGASPDVLIMTATPIPRTLAITLYGDLEISVINELPPGRKAIKTMHFAEGEKASAYGIAKGQINNGNQVFIVYPVIEESYALDMAGAKKLYADLKGTEFKDFRLGLIHGKMKEAEQDKIMLSFRNKELDLLVSTTVLEVGIDIPNATCMIIEHAERFGLSQLHQLRGRVGRGEEESFCILVSDPKTEEAKARISAMESYNDGFRIAEEDLRIRGPGEFFGRRQHGLAELKIANPLTQMQLLKRARDEAIKLISADPGLSMRQNLLLREKLLQRFPEYEKLMVVG